MPRIMKGLMFALLVAGCRDKDATPPKEAVTRETPAVQEDTLSASGRVTLSESAVRTAGITTEAARPEGAGQVAGFLAVPGQIEADPARVAMISPRIGGRLERLDAVVGDRVGAGDAVALIWSPAFQAAQVEYQLALRRAAAMKGTADSTGTAALALAARRRLLSLGATASDAARLEAGDAPTEGLVLRAPFGGSLMEQGAVVGQAVEAGQMVFRLVDLAEVDVVADVPERALPQLRRGQHGSITLVAYPGERFDGVVERIKDELDPATRTVDAILHVRNRNNRLRPGMFATVELDVVAGGTSLPVGVSVPEASVLMDGRDRIVFVALGNGVFERKVVKVQAIGSPGAPSQQERRLLVTEGVRAGDSVVVHGAFTLKSELVKSSYAEEE